MRTQISKELRRYNYLINETTGIYHDIALKLGLSDSSMSVLYALCDNDGSCLLQDICRNFGISKQTINSALRKLEQEGMIYLEPAGFKNKRVCLTKQGTILTEQTAGKLMEIENHIFAGWSCDDVEQYLKLTERYLEDLKERSREL